MTERKLRRDVAAERGGLYERLTIDGRDYFVRVRGFNAKTLKKIIRPKGRAATTKIRSERMLLYFANLVIDQKTGMVTKNRFGPVTEHPRRKASLRPGQFAAIDGKVL